MNVVMATDIFGCTQWTSTLTSSLLEQEQQVLVISPYEQDVSFDSETQAYTMFTKQGGFNAYCGKVMNSIVSSSGKPTVYIGFSAGGAALWYCLNSIGIHQDSHFIGFYPGQIRHHLDLEPSLQTTIVFPESEQHFDLTKVIEQLVTKPKLKLIQNSLQHGYANPSSKNYNENASNELLALLSEPDNLITPMQLSVKILQLQNEHKAI